MIKFHHGVLNKNESRKCIYAHNLHDGDGPKFDSYFCAVCVIGRTKFARNKTKEDQYGGQAAEIS